MNTFKILEKHNFLTHMRMTCFFLVAHSRHALHLAHNYLKLIVKKLKYEK